MTARVQIKGMDKLVKKINSLEKMDAVKAALKNAATHMAGEMKEYPPDTTANRPPTPFYIRGRGTQTAGGNLLNSEDIADKWADASRNPRISKQGLTATVGINVSYAPFVQSHKFQAQAMRKIGWKTDKQILDANEDEVTEYLIDAIEKILES